MDRSIKERRGRKTRGGMEYRERVKRGLHLRIKAKILLLLEEEIQDKLPNKVRVQGVIDHFCSAKLLRNGPRRKEKE